MAIQFLTSTEKSLPIPHQSHPEGMQNLCFGHFDVAIFQEPDLMEKFSSQIQFQRPKIHLKCLVLFLDQNRCRLLKIGRMSKQL